MSLEKQFTEHFSKIKGYEEAIALLYWDLRTGAPKKGVELRSESIGTLSAEVFNLSTSDEFGELLSSLEEDQATLDPYIRRSVEEARKEYDLSKKVPPEEYKKFIILKSKAESVWETAKDASDFSMFLPYLEDLVSSTKKMIGYWGEKNGSPYNTLLDQYEPGMTTEILDEVFGKLRNRIVPLVQKIAASPNKPETAFLYEHFPKEAQEDFSRQMLEQLGYDFEAGRLDETVHPFMISINRQDIRVTTKYDEGDFRNAVFGTIHEGGHAMYEQNLGEALAGLPIETGASMGIHESQSLFCENFIGRNEHFWQNNFNLLKEYAPKQFADVELADYVRAINESKPSLIRIEADELSYALHIMVRYELEKGLFDGDLQVRDLPQLWNDKYEEYLGVRPSNDAEGVLQDVHWAGASFGYFPSYALGYMYAAQFKDAMLKDLPNFDELLAERNVKPIREWLSKNIHHHGAFKKPLEILKEVTGEGLNPDYLADYLEEKYSKIYQLDK
ncbi:carboxypeptidase M32 [Microbacterium sp. APC 3898]|uniref:Metal-dependent carboxypeptidase n=1 Tax=Planococcus notacanthi TaxID=3035188 RepID=A0ABT7ZGN6_9BACL|nr:MULTISPECIES: carboxypeptidase M32 [Terrabacteria group]MDN3426320.1 carboxypeptidase M32 [Planococcus sp. APC 4016]MDN3498016.1 carboxypeptidase M32 [Microbacterium sp. APC 3898]